MREMEYDSTSNCKGHKKDLEVAEKLPKAVVYDGEAERDSSAVVEPRWISEKAAGARACTFVATERSLSAQVMEYYHKYSQNSSLGRYFSLPESGFAMDGGSYYRRTYESIPERVASNERYLILSSEERSRLDSSTPRERRKWARPPLIGQPSGSEGAVASTYVGTTSTESRTPSPICKRPTTETIPEERNESSRENLGQAKDSDGKVISPTSSVASHKPLEWDSGADVGYYNALPPIRDKDKKLCTIERMALARGCSAALRLDPEGTNESSATTNNATDSRNVVRRSMKPDANSTPMMEIRHREWAESESEIEITPIVKNHATGIVIECEEVDNKGGTTRKPLYETPKSKTNSQQHESPAVQTKNPTEDSENSKESNKDAETSPLKKSASMNVLASPLSRLSLKRSQSELNLHVKEKKNVQPLPHLIFNSTSSIATIVNKPATCDKFIQTSLDTRSRESIGIQVSVTETSDESTNEPRRNNQQDLRSENEDEKPPLPKRASSLVPKSLHSILKNSSNTYKLRDRSDNVRCGQPVNGNDKTKDIAGRIEKPKNSDRIDDPALTSIQSNSRNSVGPGKTDSSNASTSDSSQSTKNPLSSTRSDRAIPEQDTTVENATGRASNSFEYFPGHIYENVRNGSTSRVSSVDTGRESRCSTMPNTSSSIDEKLWGDSDSLVRDLERSVNILKSLVDANKCDKQVKKRLIHHVIKRLVTAKYTDDRIEHDLEENVPWNPADARNKVYRNEIIQALVNKHNTTDSSVDDWQPRKRIISRATTSSPKKSMTSKESRVAKEIIDLAATSPPSTPNTDEYPFDRHTERTVMDGRKARMGLRCDDRRRDDGSTVNRDVSESSECFLPQSQTPKQSIYGLKSTNVYYTMNDDKSTGKTRITQAPTGPMNPIVRAATTTMTNTSTSSKSTDCQRDMANDKIVLVKERRRNRNDATDWRLPTTMSERRFEMGRCTNSESGDAKLINYAEMEKKNQLVWITNEISHLCNLKRLLQEPKKFNDRQISGDSPRKRTDQWTMRRRSSSRGRNDRERSRLSDSEAVTQHDDQRPTRNKRVDENVDNHGQWSSHGNLTVEQSSRANNPDDWKNRQDDRDDERSFRRAKKLRNSCTQTGSDDDPIGHSKTGGEIVSSTISNHATPIPTRHDHMRSVVSSRDASVQTCPVSPKKPSNCSVVDVKKNCDKETQRHVCYCQRYAAHSRHSACMIDSVRRCARAHAKNCSHRSGDDRPIIITSTTSQMVSNAPTTNSRSNDFRKEAKNQLNANCKSKYAIRELPIRKKSRCVECELQEEGSSGPSVAKHKDQAAITDRGNNSEIDGILKICLCSMECNCETRRCRTIGNDRDKEKHDKEQEQRSQSCETSSEAEEAICHCDENFAGSRACGNDDRNTDEHRSVEGNSNERRKNLSSRMNEKKATENTRKACRTCGTNWFVRDGTNVNRKCSCTQDYLKPVAYELKFDDSSGETVKRDGVVRRNEKIGGKNLPTVETVQTKVNESLPNSGRSRGKCACDENDDKEDNEEHENQRPGTLKDFLATNKPQFLENVETRRQYMSEISQLRQLKKEKRKQYLAIAGNSAFAKPQKPSKGTTSTSQRKVSEYDMKLRLRMRYLRLNEVRGKRRQREKEEEARRNHLMAKLFGQKLQEKVLKGQVDISQSVSVISNL